MKILTRKRVITVSRTHLSYCVICNRNWFVIRWTAKDGSSEWRCLWHSIRLLAKGV